MHNRPSHRTKISSRSIAQSGRALRSGRRGRRFESCYSDHKIKPPHCGWVYFIRLVSRMRTVGSTTSRQDKRSVVAPSRLPQRRIRAKGICYSDHDNKHHKLNTPPFYGAVLIFMKKSTFYDIIHKLCQYGGGR